MSYQNIHYAKKCTLTCYKRHEIVPVILSVVFDSRVLDFDEVCFCYIVLVNELNFGNYLDNQV